jgi:uncharacterized membrane protein
MITWGELEFKVFFLFVAKKWMSFKLCCIIGLVWFDLERKTKEKAVEIGEKDRKKERSKLILERCEMI